ncbi:hypothetical protein IscW_ISCW008215 [Ixodes scapularis]|uniref:Uncharacterized protein n=1 Tax=Ixodes scapularis TaxID=6945 RepID=B7PSD0_IXOSC|nr:hypothetical protein IscW_ISCW008215 [Ixodes scapularis]|eukprot:XP_002402261.1 hypothetical protein IscW_ISCW008215 [Ixodes scapularis]
MGSDGRVVCYEISIARNGRRLLAGHTHAGDRFPNRIELLREEARTVTVKP